MVSFQQNRRSIAISKHGVNENGVLLWEISDIGRKLQEAQARSHVSLDSPSE